LEKEEKADGGPARNPDVGEWNTEIFDEGKRGDVKALWEESLYFRRGGKEKKGRSQRGD